MRLVMKTGFDGNLRQRKSSRLDQFQRLLDALTQDKLMQRHTDCRAKLAGKVKGAHVRMFSQTEESHILTQVRLDKVHHRAKLERIQFPSRQWNFGFANCVAGEQMQRESNR